MCNDGILKIKKGKMKTNKTPGVNSPRAWVAVASNRQKIYGKNEDLVYLDDNQEFQIELFNPTSEKYLAKIYLNDKLISNTGLVLKPGQRYFLDRYLDEKKKFLFSTYEVDSSDEVAEAIKNNGKVRVDFFKESSPLINFNLANTGTTVTYPTHFPPSFPPNQFNGQWWGGTPNVYCGTSTTGVGNTLGNLTTTSSLGNGITFTSSSTVNNAYYSSPVEIAGSSAINASSSILETGMIEKGSKSDQSFGSDSGTYSMYSSYTSEYQILPRSTKPIEVAEIRSYCTSCGTRMKKKTWKFCPNCGESLD
jgi:hypothetical protein